MAVDEPFAAKVRALLKGKGHIAEKRMFGGLAFMLNGNMCCAVNGEDGRRLMLRVDPGRAPALAKRKGARPMSMKGRTFDGYLWIEAAGTMTPKALEGWVEEAVTFVMTLKAK